MNLFKNTIKFGAVMCATWLLSDAQADTRFHRLTWDSDPAHQAVIGFSPDGDSQNPYVMHGTSTDESGWNSTPVSNTTTFDGSLTSHFVRLNDLVADSAVYFRVCDQHGCGQRFWFKTAPTDNTPYVAVAGGDTRTGWTNRRKGNDLIAKIRPLFIMHGGDFTNANSASEMRSFLTDWQRTLSNDTIDGLNYKRIYPLIPTHGNHEDDDYSTLCRVFGVDYNQDGNCTPADTYGAFDVSPLLRVYTLNSQFQNSGWSSYAAAMNNWLDNDLSSNETNTTWRMAQYHKPMFPHYTGKSDNTTLYHWWSDLFYNHAMNLVVESDTHINKITQALVPLGNGFSDTTTGGTVYVGEGSWGAPARSANDPKSWTIDLASIQQFKVIQVTADELRVRTAQFDASAASLSRNQRAADPLMLPASVNWWSANEVGEILTLVQNSLGLSVIDTGGTLPTDSLSLIPSDDAFITEQQADTNHNGDPDGLLADGSDLTYGRMHSLIRFPVTDIPSCAQLTSAKLDLNVTNVSSGAYEVFNGQSTWSESSVTWNAVGGDQQKGTLLASFTPSSTGILQVNIPVTQVTAWMQGNNHGIIIASGGTSNGLDMDSKETGPAPTLKVSFVQDESCGGNGGPGNGETVTENLPASDDTFISASQSGSNFDGHGDGLLADGSDFTFGEMHTLIGFDLSGLPACAAISAAELMVNVTNVSSGEYQVFNGQNAWSESTATWNSVGGDQQKGALIGSFTPSATGLLAIDLSSAAVQQWHDGVNHGLLIASGGTSNGLDMDAKETGSGPVLKVTYDVPAECGGSGQPVGGSESHSNLSAARYAWQHFTVELPTGMNNLTASISGGSGDADLYVRQAGQPTTSSYDCRPWLNGNQEQCQFNNPTAGTWYISIRGYTAYSGVNLSINWD